MAKIKEYRHNSGCWNCEHCIVFSQQDEDTVYFCNFDKKLPKFNGIKNNYYYKTKKEQYSFKDANKPEILKLICSRMDRWNRWQKKHEIRPFGICEHLSATIQIVKERFQPNF